MVAMNHLNSDFHCTHTDIVCVTEMGSHQGYSIDIHILMRLVVATDINSCVMCNRKYDLCKLHARLPMISVIFTKIVYKGLVVKLSVSG